MKGIMGRFHRQYWKKLAQKKGLFGANIKSQEEIRALNKKINALEKKEFDAFEEGFDEELKNL